MGLTGVARHFLRLSPEGIRINNNNNNNNNNKSTVIKIMMKIFNLLMESGILPTHLKVASVKPLLKKQSLSSAEFNNFSANFEHEFSAKVFEKCVAKQLIDFLDAKKRSATFDDVDHCILLSLLSGRFWIGGTALDSEWFRSYLSYGTQFLNVVMAIVLFFLLLRRFFEKVFLSILRMLDHWTFLEDSWKPFFLDAPTLINDVTVVFYIFNCFIFSL